MLVEHGAKNHRVATVVRLNLTSSVHYEFGENTRFRFSFDSYKRDPVCFANLTTHLRKVLALHTQRTLLFRVDRLFLRKTLVTNWRYIMCVKDWILGCPPEDKAVGHNL